MTTCPDCIAAGLHMKEQGFRNWRTAYACYEHAAFDLGGPEWAAMLAQAGIEPHDDHPDLFGDAA